MSELAPPPNSPVIEARATRMWMGTDGLVRSQIRPGADFTVGDSAAALAGTCALATSLPTPVLVDCRGVRSSSRESRLFFQSPAARGALSAMAILVGSPTSRVVANFFLRLVRPDFKVRIFSSEAEAARWLLESQT